jgi:fluoroacetyl-CoA thioesterase
MYWREWVTSLLYNNKGDLRIQHLGASPLESKVRAETSLKKVDGRRLVFDVIAHDEFEKIAEEKKQLMVSINKFLDRVKRKKIRNI